MTLLVAFHQSGYRTFKRFYVKHVRVYWVNEFPHLLSYSRFVELKKEVLTLYLHAHLDECSGISLVDSTRLRVCDNQRISSHRVFAAHAGRLKTSMGGFYGFIVKSTINSIHQREGEVRNLASGETVLVFLKCALIFRIYYK